MSLMIFTVGPRPYRQPISCCRLEVRNPTMHYNIWPDYLNGLVRNNPDDENDYGRLTVDFVVDSAHHGLIHTLDGYRWEFHLTRANLVTATVISGDQRITIADQLQADSVVTSGIYRLMSCRGNIARSPRGNP